MEDAKTPTSFTRRVGRLFTRTKTVRISGDNPKDAYNMIISLLTAYEELDGEKTKKKQPFRSKSGIAIDPSKPEKIDLNPNGTPLGKANYTFIFHLLNQTLGEFYNSYKVYCTHFDTDDSYKIEEKEFDIMLDFLCLPENMGKVKVRKSFEVCSPEDFRMYNKVALINPSSDHQLEPFLKKGMFTVLATKGSSANTIGEKRYVHYLKFFPLLFSYFSEFLKMKTNLRIRNMEVICGLNSAKKRLECQDPSFLDKLEHLGYNYTGDSQPTRVSFTTLEKALILFRNNYSATFGQELVPLIIKEMRAKCRVKDSVEAEEKIIPLTYKLLHWIAYRICLHCSLYMMVKEPNSPRKMPQTKVLEEYTVWAAAYNETRFDKQTMEKKFKKFILKNEVQEMKDVDDEKTKEVITGLMTKFYRKFTPHISDQTIQKIYDAFCVRHKQQVFENAIDSLSDCVFDVLVDVAGNKLMEFIETVYKSLKTENKDRRDKWKSQQSLRRTFSKSQLNLSEDHKSDESDKSPIGSLELIASENKAHTQVRRSSTKEIKSATTIQRNRRSNKMNLLSKLHLEDDETIRKEVTEIEAMLGLNTIGSKSDGISPQSKKLEGFESEVDKIISDTIRSNEKLDILVEPSLKRRGSVSSISDNEAGGMSKKISLFAQTESMKSDNASRRGSSLDTRRPKGATIDMSLISQKPDEGVYIVKASSLRSKLPDPMEETIEGDKRLVNPSTKRKVDVLNSYFIIETFLEKLVKKADEPKSATTERKERKREPSFKSTPNSPLLIGRTRSVTTLADKGGKLNLGRSSFFRSSVALDNSPIRMSKFKRAENSPSLANREETRSTEETPQQQQQQAQQAPAMLTLFKKGAAFTQINSKLKSSLRKIQARKKAQQMKSSLSPTRPFQSNYKVENQEFAEFLKKYDMKESEFIEFKRREEAERKRECEFCGTGKKCTIF